MLIYMIQNKINEKRYVGFTSTSLPQRFYWHTAQAKQNALKGMVVSKAILKYGKENFDISLLETCSSKEHMIEREKYWIEELGTFSNEYNMTKGGEGLLGYKHTEETKRKMSLSKMGNTNNKGHFKGRKHTDEAKRKISENQKGIGLGAKRSVEDRRKISEGQYKKVCQYNENGILIGIHNSFQEAAKVVDGKPQGISRCCRGIRNKHRGFIWKHFSK